MMRHVCFTISVLMFLCLFLAPETSADLGPSTLVMESGSECYQPGGDKALCFQVANSSPDGETITDVDLAFPEDWTVTDCCREGEVCPVNGGYIRS